ncbi:MAG: hypothetical protein KY464_14500 [Gemmatimonadetes bacterium]|nr:hypothetical protein [Gemmatimonadota bacterium]
MKRNWIKFPALLGLALTLVVYGCDSVSDPTSALVGPGDAAFGRGGKSEKAEGKQVKVRGKKGEAAAYTLLTGVLPERKDVHAVKLIGPKGGELKASGHKLVVPAGAVDRPTEFSLKVFKQVVDGGAPGNADNETVVGVDLKAVVYDTVLVIGDDGEESIKVTKTDVGPRGFLVPVQLSLTYAWAKNVREGAALSVAWLKKDGTAELVASRVDSSSKQVVASLHHFSPYAILFPD